MQPRTTQTGDTEYDAPAPQGAQTTCQSLLIERAPAGGLRVTCTYADGRQQKQAVASLQDLTALIGQELGDVQGAGPTQPSASPSDVQTDTSDSQYA